MEPILKPEKQKPPIGLMPKRIYKENRFNEVCAAISRYYNAAMKIPIEWVQEYNELIEEGIFKK